jgi:hypothetical protein
MEAARLVFVRVRRKPAREWARHPMRGCFVFSSKFGLKKNLMNSL